MTVRFLYVLVSVVFFCFVFVYCVLLLSTRVSSLVTWRSCGSSATTGESYMGVKMELKGSDEGVTMEGYAKEERLKNQQELNKELKAIKKREKKRCP